MKYIIVDLDGTLADCEHRQHIIQKERSPEAWRTFFLACVHDTPKQEVIHIVRALAKLDESEVEEKRIIIFSGRSDIVQNETLNWLEENAVPFTTLKMRREGDFTPDHKLKEKWAEELGWDNIFFVLEDRQSVVDMWRRHGVPCFQVAPGDF